MKPDRTTSLKRRQRILWTVGDRHVPKVISLVTSSCGGRRSFLCGSQQQGGDIGEPPVTPPGSLAHGTQEERCQELGRSSSFPPGLTPMGKRRQLNEGEVDEPLEVRPSHSTLRTGEPATWGRGWQWNAAHNRINT
jgi:hypothetical protein